MQPFWDNEVRVSLTSSYFKQWRREQWQSANSVTMVTEYTEKSMNSMISGIDSVHV